MAVRPVTLSAIWKQGGVKVWPSRPAGGAGQVMAAVAVNRVVTLVEARFQV